MSHRGHTQANLVHDGDAGGLGLGVELLHGRRDVAGGDDVHLLADGGLDDLRVEGVRDKADDEVMLANLSVQRLLIVDVQRDGVGVGDADRERLGRRERAAGCLSVAELVWGT